MECNIALPSFNLVDAISALQEKCKYYIFSGLAGKYFLAWRENISVPCCRRFGDPSLQREHSPRNCWGSEFREKELNFDLLLFRIVSSSTLVPFLKVSHDVEVCYSGGTNIQKYHMNYPTCLSHNCQPPREHPQKSRNPTSIDYALHSRYLFSGFLRRNLCSARNSKEMETLS